MYDSYSFLYEVEDLKVAFIIKVSSFTNLDFFYILLRCSLPCKIHMHVPIYFCAFDMFHIDYHGGNYNLSFSDSFIFIFSVSNFQLIATLHITLC